MTVEQETEEPSKEGKTVAARGKVQGFLAQPDIGARPDWANQPNPFRRFDGARLIPLPVPKIEAEPICSVPYYATCPRDSNRLAVRFFDPRSC